MILSFGPKKMTKIQTIKPSGLSTNLIYRCSRCNSEHWVSANSAKVVGYMIVCDCGEVFKTRPISDIKIVYKKKKKKKIEVIDSTKDNTDKSHDIQPEISDLTLSSCINVLTGYGYTKSEAASIILKTYKHYRVNNVSELIKLCFHTIGESVDEQ